MHQQFCGASFVVIHTTSDAFHLPGPFGRQESARRLLLGSFPACRSCVRSYSACHPMSLRAVLLSCAIANAAAFIAPSRAPQWLAPQLAAGRAAVLPLRALPIASVTRNDEVAKQKSPLEVCPAPRDLEGILGMAPTRGMGRGREARSASQASACAVRPLLHTFKACSQYRSLITFKVCSPHAGAP